MIEILVVVLPLFLVIVRGAALERTGIADKNWSSVLNGFALKIGFPALIFSALTKTNLDLVGEVDLLVANSALLIGSFLLAYLIGKLLRLKPENMRTLFITLAFGNVAYLGIPTLVQISGEGVLPEASLIVAVYLFWVFTVGIGVLNHWQHKDKHLIQKILLNLMKNPLLIAVFLGLVFTGFQIPIPAVIGKAINMVAASVTPIVLIVIGLFIGRSKFHNIKEWIPVFFFSLTTLLILPTIFYFGVKFAGYAPSHFATSIIEAAMPLAITPFALADIYKLNKGFIARSIVLSTILSIITIPFWTSLV